MPRRSYDKRPSPTGDTKFSNVLVARLIKKINFTGKMNTSIRIVYTAFDIIKEKTQQDPLTVFSQAVANVRPQLETKARQVGGATYQVPIEVDHFRGETMAIRWLISFAGDRKGIPMAQKLAEEIMLANRKEGAAFRKREEMHRMAEANLAFAHYRW
ncbi:30S ribosomal protein S7 [Elusimicrobiota bacterium]